MTPVSAHMLLQFEYILTPAKKKKGGKRKKSTLLYLRSKHVGMTCSIYILTLVIRSAKGTQIGGLNLSISFAHRAERTGLPKPLKDIYNGSNGFWMMHSCRVLSVEICRASPRSAAFTTSFLERIPTGYYDCSLQCLPTTITACYLTVCQTYSTPSARPHLRI